MRYRFLLLASILVGLGSCTTMYKSGQTPDDVYFSPAKTESDYVEVDNERNGRYDNDDYYTGDRYLRMKAMGRNRWSAFDDDFYYWNNPTWNNQSYFNSMRSPWSNPWVGGYGFNYGHWNSGYVNPFRPGFYSAPVIVVTRPVNPKVYTPRGGNLGSYNNRYTVDPKTGSKTYNIASTPRNSGSSSGNYYSNPNYRPVRSNSSSNSSSNSTPSRSFSTGSNNTSTNSAPRSSGSSSSGSSGSSSSGSGSAPVRSFPKGGNN